MTHKLPLAFLAAALCAGALHSQSPNWFIQPDGNDSNAGTSYGSGNAWKTLKHALSGGGTASTVAAGHIIEMAAGTYPLTASNYPITGIAVSGTSTGGAPGGSGPNYITVRGASTGAILDASVTVSGWTQTGGSSTVWQADVTNITIHDEAFGRMTVGGVDWALAPYGLQDSPPQTGKQHLLASSEDYHASNAYYCGPGAWIEWTAGPITATLYMRLTASAYMTANGYSSWGQSGTQDPDLGGIPVKFAGVEEVMALGGDTYLKFENLTFKGGQKAVDIDDTAVDHIIFDKCTFDYGNYGIVIRDGSSDEADNITFNGCSFTARLPHWIARSDCKNGVNEPLYGFQGVAIECDDVDNGHSPHHITVTDSGGVFSSVAHVFDGFNLKGECTDCIIEKTVFENVRDDGVELSCTGYDLRVSECLFYGIGGSSGSVNAAISRDGDDDETLNSTHHGKKYITKNVILCQEGAFYGRKGWQGSGSNVIGQNSPFETHDLLISSGPDVYHIDPWRIYNNTIYYRRDIEDRGIGIEYQDDWTFTTGGVRQEVFNNILVLWKDADWIALNEPVMKRLSGGTSGNDTTPQRFNGNLYWYDNSGTFAYGELYLDALATTATPTVVSFGSISVSNSGGVEGSEHQSDTASIYGSYAGSAWEDLGSDADPQITWDDNVSGWPASAVLPIPSSDGPCYSGGVNLASTSWPHYTFANSRVGAILPN